MISHFLFSGIFFHSINIVSYEPLGSRDTLVNKIGCPLSWSLFSNGKRDIYVNNNYFGEREKCFEGKQNKQKQGGGL